MKLVIKTWQNYRLRNLTNIYLAASQVEPQDNYLLLLTFENGEKRKFDMKPYLNKGVFKELEDVSLFNTVRKSFDSIEWDNEADLDPETLYADSIKVE